MGLGETTIRRVASVNAATYRASELPELIRYVDISSVGTGAYNDEPALIQREFAPGRARRKVSPGDTLLSTVRPNRRSFIFQADPPENLVASTGFAVVSPGPSADPRYLYYWISRPEFTDYLASVARGAAYPAIVAKDVEDAPIFLPPLDEQRRIAGILSAYDDLIENCQRRIGILEEMARRLYREWFVHYRYPGHEFIPLTDSPLGPIPIDWDVGRLDDILVLQRGFDLPRESRVEGSVPIYAATGITGYHDEVKVKAPGVVTGRSGTIGDVLYVQEDFWPLNTTLWAKAFPRSTPLFAYYVLSSLDLKQFNSGAAVPTLNRNDIHGIDTLVPPIALQERFQVIAGAFFTQVRTLDLQVGNLRRTRDLLLPRLLVGRPFGPSTVSIR